MRATAISQAPKGPIRTTLTGESRGMRAKPHTIGIHRKAVLAAQIGTEGTGQARDGRLLRQRTRTKCRTQRTERADLLVIAAVIQQSCS
jgi:hypothetical protein